MDQIEIDDVAPAIGIADAFHSLGFHRRLEQRLSEHMGIGLMNSECGKHTGLVPATRVLEVQTILLKLSVVDNGPITVRQLHLTMSLTGPVPVDCERSTVLRYLPRARSVTASIIPTGMRARVSKEGTPLHYSRHSVRQWRGGRAVCRCHGGLVWAALGWFS